MALPLQAQSSTSSTSRRTSSGNTATKKKEKKDEGPHYPLYNGLSVGLDLWGLGSKALGGDNLSTEITVDVNLKQRFFPLIELGYANSDQWGDDGVHYKTSAPYVRIGLDYNTLYKKEHGHMLMVGFRYGVTKFKYDITALSIDDDIYGGSVGNPNLEDDVWGGSLPYNHTGMDGTMHWVEFCLGLRAHITKRLYMGWAVRMKYRLSASTDEYGLPEYVPGYGGYGSKTMGVTYTITYKLPL